MQTAIVKEIVYNTNDNTAIVLFEKPSGPIDFSTATRFLMTDGVNTIDTDIDATAIVATATLGELLFTLGTLSPNLTIGKRAVTIKAFDPVHPNGQVLVCLDDKTLFFNIKAC